MASTPHAARLTEAHRLAQARLGALASQDMVNLWSLVDPTRLDATVPRWLRAAIPIIQNRRDASATLAADYMRTFRKLELPDAPGFTPLRAAKLDVAAVTTSLTVTGPVSLKSAMAAGTDLARAAEIAQANTARSAMRHVLDGGRETISGTTAADPYAIGYRRVGSGKTCDFCRMLISRGAVYSGETADFDAHDGCSCNGEPVTPAKKQRPTRLLKLHPASPRPCRSTHPPTFWPGPRVGASRSPTISSTTYHSNASRR